MVRTSATATWETTSRLRAPVPALPAVAPCPPSRSQPTRNRRSSRGEAPAVIASPRAIASTAPSATTLPCTEACSSLGRSAGTERDKDRKGRGRKRHPARRRGSGDEQRLHQVSTKQTSPADPERTLHRDVPPARLRPHDHQSGHVGAGNQQQEHPAAEQHEQGRLGVAEDGVGQRRDDHPPGVPPREVRLPQPRHDDVHLRPRLLQRAARGQAADRVEDPEAALHAGVHLVLPKDPGQLPAHRRPHLCARGKLERGRHDADHRERLAPRADRHGRADHVGVHVEVLPPRGVAQHQHARRLGPVLFRHERAAEEGPRPERFEERRGDRADGQPDRGVLLNLHPPPRWSTPIAAMAANDSACNRQSSKFGSDTSMCGLSVLWSCSHMTTSSS